MSDIENLGANSDYWSSEPRFAGEFYVAQGELYMGAGRIEEAAEAYTEGISETSGDISLQGRLFYERAKARIAAGDYLLAIDDLYEAHARNGNESDAASEAINSLLEAELDKAVAGLAAVEDKQPAEFEHQLSA